MSYRDDRDADQARIAALEAELAATKAKLESLEGTRSQALVRAAPTSVRNARAQKWAGAPIHLELTRTFDGTLSPEALEDLVTAIREITGDRGRTELMRASLMWTASSPEKGMGPFTAVSITVKDGKTHVAVTDRLGQLAGAMYGGIGGGIGGGGLIIPLGATFAVPLLGPAIFLAWFGGIYAFSRRLFKTRAKKRAEQLQRTFDAVIAAVATKLGESTPERSAVDKANALGAQSDASSRRDRESESEPA